MNGSNASTGTRRVETGHTPLEEMPLYEEAVRHAVRKLTGLTFRCNENSCGGRLIVFMSLYSKRKEGCICEDCGGDIVEIHPTEYYQVNHLIDVPEPMAKVLNVIREEEDLEPLKYD